MSLVEKGVGLAQRAHFGTGEVKVEVTSGAAGPGCAGGCTKANRREGRTNKPAMEASSSIMADAPRRSRSEEVMGPLPAGKAELSVG